jgi:hypothetical protein
LYNPFAGQPASKPQAASAGQTGHQGYLLRTSTAGAAQRLARACGATQGSSKQVGGVGAAALRAGPSARPGNKLTPAATTDDAALTYVQQAQAFIAGPSPAMSLQAASRVPRLADNDKAALVTLPNPPGANLCGLNAMLQALTACCGAPLRAALLSYVDELPAAERTDPDNTRARDLLPLARVLGLMTEKAPTKEARATLMRETMSLARRYRRVESALACARNLPRMRKALACRTEAVPLTGAQVVVEEVMWHMLNGFAEEARAGTVSFSAHPAAAFFRVQKEERRACGGDCGYSFIRSDSDPWVLLSQPLTDTERTQPRVTAKLDGRSVQEYLQATTTRVADGEPYRCLRCHGLRHCVGKDACGTCTQALLKPCRDIMIVDGARVRTTSQAVVEAADALMAAPVSELSGVGCGSFFGAPPQPTGVTTQFRASNVFIALTPAEMTKDGAPRKLQHKVMVPADLVLEVPHAGGSGAPSSGASGVGAHGGSRASSSSSSSSSSGAGSSGACSSSQSGSSAAAGGGGSAAGEAGESVRSYTLSAVVFHCGLSTNSGHYIAVRKLPSGTAWAVLDDYRVSAIIAADVMDGSASGTPEELNRLEELRGWHALAYFYTARVG